MKEVIDWLSVPDVRSSFFRYLHWVSIASIALSWILQRPRFQKDKESIYLCLCFSF
jgi:hypothetical protein